MEFVKISIAALKFPMSLRKAIFSYYLKKLLFINHTPTDKNMKRLVLSVLRAKGKINQYNHQNTEVTIEIEGKSMRLPLRHAPFSDVGILNEFIIYNEYEGLFVQTKKSFPSNQKINIIDGGSNIGLFTVFAKAHYPNAKIVMIEPDQGGISQFNKIAQSLKLSQIKIYNNGLLDQSGIEINITHGSSDEGNASFVVSKSNGKSTLTSINLKDIVLNENFELIHILKIDIEGSEEDVILGKNFDEELAHRIIYIALEIHDGIVNRASIEKRLAQLNFAKIISGRVDIFKNTLHAENKTL